MVPKIALLTKCLISMNHKKGLEPLVGKNARILILGSLPGDESIRKQEYYANPKNMFWDVMSRILNETVPDGYTEKKKYLERHGIALWDILYSADRVGSLDKDLKDEKFNDIGKLLQDNPSIERIVVNGGKAKKLMIKYLRSNKLPTKSRIYFFTSTSGMSRCAGWDLESLATQWSEILIT